MKQAFRWGWVMFAGASACAKASSQESPESSTPASEIVTTSAEAGVHASTTAPPAVASWKGSYKSVAAGIALPKGVSWKVPESALGLGDGVITLTIDSANGRVLGTVDGPLGPATLDGLESGGRLTANVLRQDPGDHGFIGTLAADVSDGGAEGTMNVALAEVSAVRSAAFHLSPVN